MSGLETAIKNALDRADRTNPEVRARIYQSARNALEAGLRKQDVSDPAILAAQRHKLEDSIKGIEHEERIRLGLVAADPAADLDYDGFSGDVEPETDRDETRFAGEGFGGLRAERLSAGPGERPVTDAPEISAGRTSGRPSARPKQSRASGAPMPNPRKKRRRGAFARLFISVIFVTFVAMGAYWAYTSDLFLSNAERDTSVPNPPASVSEGDLPADGDAPPPSVNSANSFSKDWVEIFKPGDADRVSAGGLATAKLTTTGDGPVIRVTSTSAKDDGAVRILLTPESLALAKGQPSTIAVSLRSSSDDTVEVTIACDFGGEASCERHRFTVSSQRSDALIQVVPGAAGKTEQPALVLNSDLDGKGRGVDLLAVRILPTP